MTSHFIPFDAPVVHGSSRAFCGQLVPRRYHSGAPTCGGCATGLMQLDRSMQAMANDMGGPLAEDYPEPDEGHPEPDQFCHNEDMAPLAEVAARVIGFQRPAAKPVVQPPAPEIAPPTGEFLTTSLEQAAVTLAVVEQSKSVIQTAEAIQVTDADSWLRGIDVFDILRSFEKAVSDHYTPHVQRAHAVWNGLTTERRRHLEPIEKARMGLGERCAIWKAAEDKRERDEQLRRERDAREEQQLAAARDALRAERDGDPETAKQILEEAKTAPLPAVARQSTAPTSTKATTPLRWVCNVLDLPLLLAAIGRGEFPEFHAPILETLQPILNRLAPTLKGEMGKKYPGTEGRQKPSTAGRG